MEKTKILLVEDDKNLGTLLQDTLISKGYDTKLAHNGKEGFELFKRSGYDICVLDVMMPVKDGITLAKEIRAQNAQTPILFLTAKSMTEDAIEGFKAGADDYVTKPFSMEELLLRIEAVLKRTKGSGKKDEQSEFKIGSFTFDYRTQTLIQDGEKQSLTTKEADLLKLLCTHQNEVLDRNFALNIVWANDNYFNSRSMDVYISRLRKYLKGDPSVEILNIHGKGFKLLVK